MRIAAIMEQASLLLHQSRWHAGIMFQLALDREQQQLLRGRGLRTFSGVDHQWHLLRSVPARVGICGGEAGRRDGHACGVPNRMRSPSRCLTNIRKMEEPRICGAEPC
jgi:hypothetical protein